MSDKTATTFIGQLRTASTVILANGWCDQDRLTRAEALAAGGIDPLPTAGRSRVAQFLVDQRLISREQAQDLDAIMRLQVSLPSFHLLRKIGSGGMGVVFLATHLASGRNCALKTLNTRLAGESDFITRFHREANSLVGIQHPSIAEVIESGDCDGHCYLAMEFIDGPSVMTLLRDYKALPEQYALRVIKQIAEGLGFVYQRSQLVHRDIKPENILIVRGAAVGGELFGMEDQAKLIDFGLVKSMDDDDQRLTQTGMTIGTPLYMSPEQVRGETLDCRSDIYGLGATLFHLVTGVTPFTGSSPGAIMSAHLTEAIPDPAQRVPSLSAETKQIITTAMAKDPAQRFHTHEALVAACENALTLLHGKGEGTPKFLRKPLVLNKARKPETGRVMGGMAQRSASAPAGSSQPAAAAEIGSRILAHQQAARAEVENPPRPGTHAVQRGGPSATGTPSAGSRMPASASPSPTSSPSLGTLLATESGPQLGQAAVVPRAPDSELVAEAREAHHSGRIGLVPILVLVGAVALLVGYLVFFL